MAAARPERSSLGRGDARPRRRQSRSGNPGTRRAHRRGGGAADGGLRCRHHHVILRQRRGLPDRSRSLVERQAQSAVARAIHPRGVLVLNADDLAVADEKTATAGEPVYYAMSRRNPIIKAHLADGGRAACISSGMIVLCEGRRTVPVLPTREVAVSLGGRSSSRSRMPWPPPPPPGTLVSRLSRSPQPCAPSRRARRICRGPATSSPSTGRR